MMWTLCCSIMSHATLILFYHASLLTPQNSLILRAILVGPHMILWNLELYIHESWTRYFTPHCKAHSDSPKPLCELSCLAHSRSIGPVVERTTNGLKVERTMNVMHVPHHNLCDHMHSNIQTPLDCLICPLQIVLDHQSHLLLKPHLSIVEASIPDHALSVIYRVLKFRSGWD